LTVRVEGDAQGILAAEAAVLADTVNDREGSEGYRALAAAVAHGEVHDPLVPALERLLDLGLRTGRVRRLHGPHAEAAMTRVYHATPAGQTIAAALAEINIALSALQGQPLDRLTFGAGGPGCFTLSIDTPAARLTVDIRPEGIALKDVSVGA
jgi:hypothetical protein